MQKIRVLFVCLGNICRSPSAEGVFRQMVTARGLQADICIDSAGTGGWHIGMPPDSRAIIATAQRGVDISSLRGRQVEVQDFMNFDYLIAMDRENLSDLSALAPTAEQHKCHLLMSFAQNKQLTEVPDPYFGGQGGFVPMLDLIESASAALLNHLIAKHS